MANIATVAEAVDGTTLRLTDGRDVLLGSIIAPGILDGDPDAEVRAKAALAGLARGKRIEFFAQANTTDRYGRIPAQAVQVEGLWLEATLLERGFVRALPGSEEKCTAALLAHERKARAANAGLWANTKFKVFAATDVAALSAAAGRFAVVEGTIRRVGEYRNRIFLDFGRRYVEDFSVVIPRDLRRALAAKGLEPKNWRGKRIRVRGVLGSWGGPAIELNSATAIEMLDTNEP